MSEQTFESLKKCCLYVAKYSFIFGSVIFFSFILTRIPEIEIAGFIYNVTACLVNGLLVLVLVALIACYPRSYWKIFQLILILLFNLPVAIFYLFIATDL